MLLSLELENFKAFGSRVQIPFAPITLIFGENSAGKSTILHALNLLKQTRESRDTGALLLPRAENGIVDLGSFQEMLFDHNLERELSIRIDILMDKIEALRLSSKKREIAIEFTFKRPSIKDEVLLSRIAIYYGKPSRCIARFHPLDKSIGESKEFSRELRRFSRGFGFYRDSRDLRRSKLAGLKCVWLTDEPEYWKDEFEWSKSNYKKIISWLEERKHSQEELQEDNEHSEEMNGIDENIKFFSSDFDLKAYISKRQNEEIDRVVGVQGFLPVVAGFRSSSAFYRYDRGLLDVAQMAVIAGHALERTLEVFFPMGPFRRPPERLYIFTGTSPQDVGYRGDLLPDLLFRQSALVKETNEWLKRLDIGYEIEVKPVGARSGDLFEVRLKDTRRRLNKRKINVALPDVGYGISQLLPFVVQSLVSRRQIISIEQPEVHVHPKLQADLGDLLAEAIQAKRNNQFIIETHSEHLILRLQRLVCEKKIKPTDVSVIYISRGLEGAKSQRLRLDEDGDFIDEWPDGFFPERLRELRW